MSRWRYALALATVMLTVLGMEAVVGHAIPLRVPLDDFPFRIGPWAGRAEPADPAFLARAQPQEFINRRYVDGQGRMILFYVGYYGQQAARGQVQTICYAECDIDRVVPIILHLGAEAATVSSADVVQNRVPMVVIFWHQQGGGTIGDPYREKIELLIRALLHHRTDGAVVRISAPLAWTAEEADERVRAFATMVMPLLRLHFPD